MSANAFIHPPESFKKNTSMGKSKPNPMSSIIAIKIIVVTKKMVSLRKKSKQRDAIR